MRIGAHQLRNALFVAPMAGITDRPFRRLARRYGAAIAVSEMLSSRPELRESRKTRLRADHSGEPGPISVQIAGSDPAELAEAARYNVAHGAEIIDINMGCPAKKVCNVAAGSALLEDEARVARILEAVVAAVEVPVTLKIRTGPAPLRRNAVRIARLAEAAGVRLAPPPAAKMGAVLIEHLEGLYTLYGSVQGARVARKHIGWTVRELPGGEALRCAVNKIDAAAAQCAAVNDYFERLAA